MAKSWAGGSNEERGSWAAVGQKGLFKSGLLTYLHFECKLTLSF